MTNLGKTCGKLLIQGGQKTTLWIISSQLWKTKKFFRRNEAFFWLKSMLYFNSMFKEFVFLDFKKEI